MLIAIPIFDKLTVLDAIGPYEVLHRLPDTRVVFVAHEAGPIRADSRMLTLVAESAFADVPEPDVVVVPGGWGTRALLDDATILDWLRHAHDHTTFTTSVCTGALLLAAAGILAGLEATTHWGAMHELERLGATPVERRVVRQGKVITAAGVSSGIDMALTLAAELTDERTAEAIQLMIEYDPQPPFDSGSIRKASPEVQARLGEIHRN